jgi:uncharacterized protein (DUF4415 family)
MPKLKAGTQLPTGQEEAQIALGIALDADTVDLSVAHSTLKRVGRPRSETPKVLLSVRYDADIVAAFKATGRGWQTRMNNALREWLERG